MATSGRATLHGLFSLKENVTLEAFLPALEDYLRHLHAAGYVVWSKNSCGLVMIVGEQPTEPLSALDR